MELLIEVIKNIIKLIRTFNDDLKKGIYRNLQLEVDSLFKRNYVNLKKKYKLIDSPNFGINLELVGLTSQFLFPYILYINDFRLEIIKRLEKFIERDITYDQFVIFLSKELISTFDTKKGGFFSGTLELLRFYFQYFNLILDNSMTKYEPYFNDYQHKYYRLSKKQFLKRFELSQQYSRIYFIPNPKKIYLSALFVNYDTFKHKMHNLHGKELGILTNNLNEKQFLFLYLSNTERKNFKSNIIRRISFFENLDLFYKNPKYHKLRNKVVDIFELYTDYKENNFNSTSVEFNSDFVYKEKKINIDLNDNEIIINIFNTRHLPSNFEIHPQLGNYFSYRNKLVTFYSSINYYIHIYDTRSKNLDRYIELLDTLLKNTFSNGYIIHYRTGLLVSTNAFREDFEKVRKEFTEFIWSFKLECQIFENLNFIPFSFYHLPNSQYYSNETNQWEFPVFEDKPTTEYFDHLAINYRQEINRLNDVRFKARVESTLKKLNNEIKEIKGQKRE